MHSGASQSLTVWPGVCAADYGFFLTGFLAFLPPAGLLVAGFLAVFLAGGVADLQTVTVLRLAPLPVVTLRHDCGLAAFSARISS